MLQMDDNRNGKSLSALIMSNQIVWRNNSKSSTGKCESASGAVAHVREKSLLWNAVTRHRELLDVTEGIPECA